jgi:hypothetical protein
MSISRRQYVLSFLSYSIFAQAGEGGRVAEGGGVTVEAMTPPASGSDLIAFRSCDIMDAAIQAPTMKLVCKKRLNNTELNSGITVTLVHCDDRPGLDGPYRVTCCALSSERRGHVGVSSLS